MPDGILDVGERHAVTMIVNGTERSARVEPRMLLVDLLREDLGLTGTHIGCEHGLCGACTVILDGDAVLSCLVLAVQVDGWSIETVEGLAHDPDAAALGPLQAAFRDSHALQCGYCTPGMLMAAAGLLRRVARPTEADVREALVGNICRCTGYEPIVDAVLAASRGVAKAPDQAPPGSQEGPGRASYDVIVETDHTY